MPYSVGPAFTQLSITYSAICSIDKNCSLHRIPNTNQTGRLDANRRRLPALLDYQYSTTICHLPDTQSRLRMRSRRLSSNGCI